jgi:hypothetical protein
MKITKINIGPREEFIPTSDNLSASKSRPITKNQVAASDVLALKSHNLDATTFWSAPRISATLPSGIADSARHRRVRFVENGML